MGARRAVVVVLVVAAVVGAALGLVLHEVLPRSPATPLRPLDAGPAPSEASVVPATRPAGVPEAGAPTAPAAGAVAAGGDPVADALRILRAWDTARSAAYARGSVVALRDLYTPRSAAGASDVRLLRDYRARGFRVAGLGTQVLALSVLERRADRWTLRVTDRVVGAVAVRAGRRLPLPRDASSTRVVTLVRGSDERWRVALVLDGSVAGPGVGPGVS